MALGSLAGMAGAFQGAAQTEQGNINYQRGRLADIQNTALDQLMNHPNTDPRVIAAYIDGVYGKGASQQIAGIPAILKAQGLLPVGDNTGNAAATNQANAQGTNTGTGADQSGAGPASNSGGTQLPNRPVVNQPSNNPKPTATNAVQFQNLANVANGPQFSQPRLNLYQAVSPGPAQGSQAQISPQMAFAGPRQIPMPPARVASAQTADYSNIPVNMDAIPIHGKAILYANGQIQIHDKIIGMVNGKPQVVGMA